jgi:hypothetical protein
METTTNNSTSFEYKWKYDPDYYSYKGEVLIVQNPKLSEWKCHLFGSDGTNGITYHPVEGKVPNFFIRWMMKICLGCTWVKVKNES